MLLGDKVIKTSKAMVHCGIDLRTRALGRCSTECLHGVLTFRSVGHQFRVIAALITKSLLGANILCTTISQSTETVPLNTKPPYIATAVLKVEESRYNYRPRMKLKSGLHRFEWTASQETEDKSPLSIARRHLLGSNRSALQQRTC